MGRAAQAVCLFHVGGYVFVAAPYCNESLVWKGELEGVT